MKDYKRISYDRLSHMNRAINEIESFTLEIDKKEFLDDNLLSSAVLFQT